MKRCVLLITIVAAVALGPGLRASEREQLRSDLVGQSMGGREKSWRFQAVDQIKELAIKDKREDAQTRVYIVSLRLAAANGGGSYAAEARIQYANGATGWRIKHV